MKFKMTHKFFTHLEPEVFTETTAPNWLTSCNTIKGSTMDTRWFWNDYVLQLKINQSIDTDHRQITRIE